jgi:hypothetical protein
MMILLFGVSLFGNVAFGVMCYYLGWTDCRKDMMS